MNKRLALILYLALWAVVSAGVIYGLTRAGQPVWAAIVTAYLLLVIVNRSLTYLLVARQLKREGKEAPPYLKFVFIGDSVTKFREEAPRSAHVLVGIMATLAGAFFVFCGAALTIDAEWSRISHPAVAGFICLAVVSLGAGFLYLAWRLFAFRRTPNEAA